MQQKAHGPRPVDFEASSSLPRQSAAPCLPVSLSRSRVSPLLLLLALLGGPGCLSCFHPVAKPTLEQTDLCQTLPRDCRGGVYVFLINGVDPFRYGNLSGLRDHLIGLGFNNVYYGELYHTGWFGEELRRVHKENPDARFVVVGYSRGAEPAGHMAHEAAKEGIPIDLLLYLDARIIPAPDVKDQLPIGRTVHLQSDGPRGQPSEVKGAESVVLTKAGHFEVPSHPYSVEFLTSEVIRIAQTVPVTLPPDEPPPPLVPPAPPPRPVIAQKPGPRDEWDFLKPVSRFKKQEAVPPTILTPYLPATLVPLTKSVRIP